MKLERSNVEYPLWRKKVDSSLFRHKGTTIPNWACRMWGIQEDFFDCTSRRDPTSKVQVEFRRKRFEGWVTIAKHACNHFSTVCFILENQVYSFFQLVRR